MTLEYTTRPAVQADYRYCYQLTKKNMLELFTLHWGGWEPSKFREGFDVNTVSIILVAGRRAGYFSIKTRPDGLYVDNIQLSRPLRGRGIGTSILMHLIAENPLAGIHLTTFSDNPAKRLYERLGFVIRECDGMTIHMSLSRNEQSGQTSGKK